jgi:hypothetical protein
VLLDIVGTSIFFTANDFFFFFGYCFLAFGFSCFFGFSYFFSFFFGDYLVEDLSFSSFNTFYTDL